MTDFKLYGLNGMARASLRAPAVDVMERKNYKKGARQSAFHGSITQSNGWRRAPALQKISPGGLVPLSNDG